MTTRYDTNRLRRGRTIQWPVSSRTRSRFDDLLDELLDLEGIDDPWAEQRRQALQEDIRSLPGYPRKYDPDQDLIVPIVTTEWSH